MKLSIKGLLTLLFISASLGLLGHFIDGWFFDNQKKIFVFIGFLLPSMIFVFKNSVDKNKEE